MSKFKVGDKVLATWDKYSFMCPGQLWTVVEVHNNQQTLYFIQNKSITQQTWPILENELISANSTLIKQRLGIK